MFWKTLGRLFIVPLGFLLALAASAFVLVTLGLEKITHARHQAFAAGAGLMKLGGKVTKVRGVKPPELG